MNDLLNGFERRVTRRIDYRKRRLIKKGAFYGSIAVWLIVLSLPLYWMGLSSLRQSEALFTTSPTLVPSLNALTLANYSVLTHTDVFQLFVNTLIIASGVMGVTVGVSTIAGYGLTRFDFPFKLTFARSILFGYMLAPIVLAIPMYIIFRNLGLLNTYLGVILAQSTMGIPFGVWLMWKLFQSVSVTQEEAAMVLGASRLKTFKDIAIPNAKPGIMAVGLFNFSIVWNDFTYSRILLPDLEKTTLSPGLVMLATQGQYINEGHLMAIGVFMSLIPIGVAYWLQNYLLAGFSLR